jgi:hypothetical protein
LSLCIHHPNPLPSSVSNTSPIPAHTYITHHVHRSLFPPFCFISNRLPFVITSPYTRPIPLASPVFPFGVYEPPVFCIQPGCLLWLCPHIFRIARYTSGVLCLIRWFTSLRASSIKFLNITTACTVFLPFFPTKIISYASVVTTSPLV